MIPLKLSCLSDSLKTFENQIALPDGIFQPKIELAAYMWKRIEDQGDPEASSQVPV